MTAFDNREQAFEKKFQHDEEKKFKVNARKAKLFGAWLAHEMGLVAAEADEYAKAMVVADLETPDDSDIIAKAEKDLAAKNISHISRAKLEAEIKRCFEEAIAQLA